MQGSTLTRSLLVSVALVVAGPVLAQSIDKEASTASKQGSAKSATKPTTAAKRLDFAPSNAVKQTTTQAPSSQPAQAPAKQDSHCHEHGSDA